MASSARHNWERLVRAAIKRGAGPGSSTAAAAATHATGGGVGLASAVPTSLGKRTNIDQILQAADDIEDDDPNVARILPFKEDDKDPRIWFLDHNYHKSMFSMFKRINAKEHVVGWYCTGSKLKENDLDVPALFNKLMICGRFLGDWPDKLWML